MKNRGGNKKMIIGFWSNFHGQTATTSNAITAAINLSMKYNLKTLLFHNQYIKSNLESAFISEKENKNMENMYTFDEMGIDAVAKLINSGQLTQDNIKNYTTEVGENLSLIIGSTKREERFKEIEKQISKIVLCSGGYDVTLIDLNSGINECSKNIILNCDLVVVNLNQNEKVLTDFFNNIPKELQKKKYMIVLGKYNPESKFTIKYIRKVFKVKNEIAAVPYNVNYLDSHNNHKVMRYFKSLNSNLNKSDEDYYFREQVNLFTNIIVQLLNIDVDLQVSEISKKSKLFGIF